MQSKLFANNYEFYLLKKIRLIKNQRGKFKIHFAIILSYFYIILLFEIFQTLQMASDVKTDAVSIAELKPLYFKNYLIEFTFLPKRLNVFRNLVFIESNFSRFLKIRKIIGNKICEQLATK
ncbi:hypothetical protein BpHYR1_015063 [Brachionus plicatilis]|uniref:Transmembrane protein n=1 Tax=Brachionus plicatilis TaxID=10195 RepID=A0A3M7SN93_BRAPC|nr:hypothetical protein BpHYR1_015063 [Brachionus plicatilis]